MIIKSISCCFPIVPFKHLTQLIEKIPKPDTGKLLTHLIETNPKPDTGKLTQLIDTNPKPVVISGITQPTIFADKVKDRKPGKEEQLTIKMPGFIDPEGINEEEYFTRKTKQQLEELKRKPITKPNLTNPEK